VFSRRILLLTLSFSTACGDQPPEPVRTPPTSVSYQGFRIQVHVLLADGSFLGVPEMSLSIRFGLWGNDPIHTTTVLRVRQSEQGWLQEEVLTYNSRNATLRIPVNDGSYFARQPYSDADWRRFDRETGAVLLGVRTGEELRPGEADMIEVSASGDTVWRRRVALAPVRLTRTLLEPTLDSLESVVNRTGGSRTRLRP